MVVIRGCRIVPTVSFNQAVRHGVAGATRGRKRNALRAVAANPTVGPRPIPPATSADVGVVVDFEPVNDDVVSLETYRG